MADSEKQVLRVAADSLPNSGCLRWNCEFTICPKHMAQSAYVLEKQGMAITIHVNQPDTDLFHVFRAERFFLLVRRGKSINWAAFLTPLKILFSSVRLGSRVNLRAIRFGVQSLVW